MRSGVNGVNSFKRLILEVVFERGLQQSNPEIS